MDKRKRKRLQSAGWRIADTAKFLGLDDEEAAIVELKLGLAHALKEKRASQGLTQEKLGKLLGSSQSRIAKIEAADSSVSIDLMIRSLIKMGANRKEVASYIAAPGRQRAA